MVTTIGRRAGILQNAGFRSGDVLPLASWSPTRKSSENGVTTSTYTQEYGFPVAEVDVSGIAPDTSKARWAIGMWVDPGTDETGFVKARDDTNSADVVEVSGSSTGTQWSGWTAYEPATNPIEISTYLRTDPGTNGTDFFSPSLYLGVEL